MQPELETSDFGRTHPVHHEEAEKFPKTVAPDAEAALASAADEEPAPSYAEELGDDGRQINYRTLEWWYVLSFPLGCHHHYELPRPSPALTCVNNIGKPASS